MIDITKASGAIVPFEPDKLRKSLKRVGTEDNLINEIINEVMNVLVPGMSTRTIYQIAFRLLKKKSQTSAAKFHLKRAIMHLGVSGYPFEKYVSELMQCMGYKTITNIIIKGHCVNHEVDIIAKKDNTEIIVECKYHHRPGLKCDVTIALYFKARFIDIEQASEHTTEIKREGWLVTNTRFTSDAMQYGRCANLHLISWDYPERGSLQQIIDTAKLYPITCITNFTKAETNQLLDNNIILCKTIRDNPQLLDPLRIPSARKNAILQQCKQLCLSV
ncbi:MAG: restriction endonuclease [Gammaproteobacteria bacterium]|nr:restriction endonuclease [Gammaproteobacteria bacterium]